LPAAFLRAPDPERDLLFAATPRVATLLIRACETPTIHGATSHPFE
jgi:hypothetical protein